MKGSRDLTPVMRRGGGPRALASSEHPGERPGARARGPARGRGSPRRLIQGGHLRRAAARAAQEYDPPVGQGHPSRFSCNHPNSPILKTIQRPSRDPSTGEIPALHHYPGAPTLPKLLVQISLASLGDYDHLNPGTGAFLGFGYHVRDHVSGITFPACIANRTRI